MNLAIVGSREWDDWWSIYQAILDVVVHVVTSSTDFAVGTISFDSITIVSGGAQGVDSIAADIARNNDLPLVEHLPEWDRYGSSAGHVRNQLIVDDADLVLAFQRNRSSGTQSTINKAQASGVPCIVWTYEEAIHANPGTIST